MQSLPGTGSGSAFVLSGNIFGIYASGSCGIVQRSRDPIHPRFAEAMKMLPTVNELLDCLLGNDLLLAKQTAKMLCDDGHIQRLSEYLGTLSEKERDCA